MRRYRGHAMSGTPKLVPVRDRSPRMAKPPMTARSVATAMVTVWSPALNAQGNSLLGALALELITAHTGWSVF